MEVHIFVAFLEYLNFHLIKKNVILEYIKYIHFDDKIKLILYPV